MKNNIVFVSFDHVTIDKEGVWRCEEMKDIVDHIKNGLLLYDFDDFYEKVIKNRRGKIIRFGHEKKRLGKIKITQVKRYVTKVKKIKKGLFTKLCEGIYNLRNNFIIVVTKKEWSVTYISNKPILHIEKRKNGIIECSFFNKRNVAAIQYLIDKDENERC